MCVGGGGPTERVRVSLAGRQPSISHFAVYKPRLLSLKIGGLHAPNVYIFILFGVAVGAGPMRGSRGTNGEL